jgi:hypothetical protein
MRVASTSSPRSGAHPWRLWHRCRPAPFQERAACQRPRRRHLRARPRRPSLPLRWLLLTALTVPLVAGVTGVGKRRAEAAPGSPEAVAVRSALGQLDKP